MQPERAMPLLTDFARKKKIRYFLDSIPGEASILEIGAGSGWVGAHLRATGHAGYVGMDLEGGADVNGDIKALEALPFTRGQFDVIIAFEVIEHVDLLEECRFLLRDGGQLMLTTPLPSMDWLCQLFEAIGLNQKRTSPHCNMTDIRTLPGFATERFDIVGFMGQWGIYRKTG
jgi:2-polyprenyl-3-methyl-5-hydroxy-6-metoxy-1,4-benzoquinol methylase